MVQVAPTQVDSPSRWRTWLVLGAVLMLGGLLLAVVSLARLLATVPNNETPAILDAPVTVVDYYEPGTYVVYQSQQGSGLLQPDQVEVRGAVGQIPVTSSRVQDTITDGSGTWVSAAQFTVEQAGEYTVAVSAPGAQVRVATSLVSKVGGTMASGSAFALGALLGLVGLMLVVVGLVRRPSVAASPGPGASVPSSTTVARATPAPSVAPPAGWYADPTVVGGQRYWDGSAWTEYTA